MGIGKSTTLLCLTKINNNYCNISLKAFNVNEKYVLIWKYQLLWLEVDYAM